MKLANKNLLSLLDMNRFFGDHVLFIDVCENFDDDVVLEHSKKFNFHDV
jgi:hypothetical protein